jgi:acetylornithine/N-succinyldiaminopimelate aminotransferase
MEPKMKSNDNHVMNTYARFPVAFDHGQGAKLWDEQGREYLDFLAGIAVVNLGHAHPAVARAISEQAAKLLHTSNIFQIRPQIELADRLCALSFADQAFFCNSGTEANEAALKLARKWGATNKNGAAEIITMEGSFHGRTMFALSVTGQSKFHAGFAPLVPGVSVVPYNDVEAVARAVSDRTAAVIVEPVQAEGGVRAPAPDYLPRLRELCDRERVLLIYDEVQTGIGRTGKLFAYEHSGAAPDIMTLAKALGNGFPIGAMLANAKAASAFVPGNHAATFGGNFLACQAALAVLGEFADGRVLAHVVEVGAYFRDRLREVADRHDCVMEVRGQGLLLGLALDRPGRAVAEYCLQHGMVINCTADTVLRFSPPLIIARDEIDRLIPVLDEGLAELEQEKSRA